MLPTPRALALKEPVHRVVTEARRALEPERPFVAAELDRDFVVHATDYVLTVLGGVVDRVLKVLAEPVRSAEPELPGLSASLPWLTERMPEAILAGTPIPAAPIIAGPPRREQPAGRLRSLLRRR